MATPNSEQHLDSPETLSVLDAVTQRRSVRRFLSTPVPQSTVSLILQAAARAPSGTNSQPWKVHVVVDAARDRLSIAARVAAVAGRQVHEYVYAPSPLMEPYLSRRRKVGYELYKLYRIDPKDKAARAEAMLPADCHIGSSVAGYVMLVAARQSIRTVHSRAPGAVTARPHGAAGLVS